SGNPISGAVVTWSVSNALLATVSGSGLVTALSLGSVTVTATSGGKTGSATITIAAPSSTTHKGWYASPTGSSSGAGTTSSPWSLTTALAGGNGKVQPGDTVWLRGGTYRGAYTSTVAGTASAPVVIAQYPGERATLDGAGLTGDQLIVKGQWTVFMDFEVMNSSPSRSTSTTSNNWRPNNVVNNASNTKYINLIIHDGGVAFFNYTTQRNVEVYGCILYNNGWQAPDRGHGHGLYVKSDVGPVVLRDNILFGQFGYGIHIYSNSGSGFLNNITLDGNVAFNNGTTSNNSTSPNILYGGSATATGATVVNNLTYYSPGAGGANVRIGHGSTKNGSASVQGNYAVGGSPVLDLGYWSSATVSSNTLVGSSTVVALNDATTSGKQFSANTHRRDPSTSSWKYKGTSYNWTSWKSATALASSDQAMTGVPTATHVVTRVNPHVKGRGYVAVYNWARQGSVSVSLSGILSVGDQYVVRNAQNPFGAPVASGTFGGGSVTLPLSGITPPAPIGWTRSAPKTGPDFDVFVVQKI
ncbi:MAG: Ig-like domain-containing protein, partial [Gemmatimonadales bacterium]